MNIELISATLAVACLWFSWRYWQQQYRRQPASPDQLAFISALLFVVGLRMLFWSNAFAWSNP